MLQVSLTCAHSNGTYKCVCIRTASTQAISILPGNAVDLLLLLGHATCSREHLICAWQHLQAHQHQS